MSSEPYRILLTYNISPGHHKAYYQYMLGEFVPIMQRLQLQMLSAWHVYGNNHPQRQVEFVCTSRELLREALNNPEFQQAEDRLQSYTTAYSRKIVRFQDRFQF